MLRFDHIGYAVASITEYLETFFVPLFQPVEISPIVEDPLQSVRIAFATLDTGTRIELIEPTNPSSPVGRFLTDPRGGLYHLCYSTDSLDQAVDDLRRLRCTMFMKPTPAVAFGGRRIAFFVTPQRDLLEVVENSLPE